jgi:hypothetical protein
MHDIVYFSRAWFAVSTWWKELQETVPATLWNPVLYLIEHSTAIDQVWRVIYYISYIICRMSREVRVNLEAIRCS